MPINTIIYARTSPDCPMSADDQIKNLRTVAANNGWTVVKTFSDRPMPIRRGRERRPSEDALLDAIRGGGMHKVLLWSVDRVGRTLTDLVAFIESCRIAGVGLYLHDRNLDTAGSNGLSVFDVSQMLAFHVRQARRDKILRGQAAARDASVRFGRPPIPTVKVEKARQALASGKGVRQAARAAGISPASVSRLKSGIESSSPAV
jgi:DNA invertase Pin-like site-specific DNA recombinase